MSFFAGFCSQISLLLPELQCKIPYPLGKCTTLFWGGFLCFLVFCSVLFSFAFFSLLFGGNGRKWEQGGGRWILFIFLAHFQGVGGFFLICVMNKVVFENKNLFGLLGVRIIYLFSYFLLDPRWLLILLCGSAGVVEGKFSLTS